MSLGAVTKGLLLVVVLALAGWTSICMLWGMPGDTVSETVRHYCALYPFLPVALGFVLGHWYWPLRLPVGQEVP